MAFSPVYYQESNNAWLNDLIGDIIEPDSRSQSRTESRNLESGAAVDAVDSDIDYHSTLGRRSPLQWRRTPPLSSRFSPISNRSTSTPPVNRYAHWSYRSQTPRASYMSRSASESSQRPTFGHDMAVEAISEEGGPLSLDPFHTPSYLDGLDPDRETPAAFRETPSSQNRLLHHTERPESRSTRDSVSSSFWVPERSSSLRAAKTDRSGSRSCGPPRSYRRSAWSENTQVGDGEVCSRPSRSTSRPKTSLGRTYSQKELTDLQKPPLARLQSNITEEFAGYFTPHPAVRPFSGTEALGEAAAPDDDDHVYPKPVGLALIVIGICLSVFIISVDRNIVTTAIPQITETFQSYSDIGWYGSAYFLTASAFQPLYGRIYMSFDTRWTFLLALGIFELGSLLGAVSPNSNVLILGRSVQGFGSAGILTGSFVVGTHSVPLRGRPVLFAFVGILYGVGALAGPLLGGIFTDLLTWRWAFWINLPCGAVTFIAVFFFFKPKKNKNTADRPTWIKRFLALDLIGNGILLGSCTMLFLALQISETKGSWNNAPVIGLLSGFGVSALIFVGWLIYRKDRALIPPRIIIQRTVASSCGAAFFLYGGLLLHAYYLPIWFQAIQGDSAIHSGVNMIPYMLANALFSLLAGIFVSKNGLFAPPAILGTAIGCVGCGLLATLKQTTSTSTWIGYEILVSAGLGMAIQQGFSAVQTALPLEEVPIGTAAVVACQSLGGAIFVSIGNTILQDHLLNQNADNAVPGVDVRAVFTMGATEFRSFVPAGSLPALIELYNKSLQGVFIAAVPLIGCAFLCSLCMEWRSVKNKQEAKKELQDPEIAEEKEFPEKAETLP